MREIFQKDYNNEIMREIRRTNLSIMREIQWSPGRWNKAVVELLQYFALNGRECEIFSGGTRQCSVLLSYYNRSLLAQAELIPDIRQQAKFFNDFI